MSEGSENPQAPGPPDARDRPRVGVDTWVAEVEGRREQRGLTGIARRLGARTPWWAWLAAAVAFGAAVSVIADS